MKRSVEEDDVGPDPSLIEVKSAIECIALLFRDPLEARGANQPVLQDKTEDAADYARRYMYMYLGHESTNYRKV
jgi:hypothetical protein